MKSAGEYISDSETLLALLQWASKVFDITKEVILAQEWNNQHAVSRLVVRNSRTDKLDNSKYKALLKTTAKLRIVTTVEKGIYLRAVGNLKGKLDIPAVKGRTLSVPKLKRSATFPKNLIVKTE